MSKNYNDEYYFLTLNLLVEIYSCNVKKKLCKFFNNIYIIP